MYRVLFVVFCCLPVFDLAASETNIFVDSDLAEKVSQGSFCPATIFTGPQSSASCSDPLKYINALGASEIPTDVEDDPPALKRCENDLKRLSSSLLTDDWARQMIDAAGKPSSGILQGNIMWIGDYFQCINSSAPAIGSKNGFDGQYCTAIFFAEIVKNFSLPVIMGICVPDTCSENMLMNLTDLTRQPLPNAFLPGLTTGISCKHKKLSFDAPAIAMLVIISIFIALVTAGTSVTLLEQLLRKNDTNVMPPVDSAPDLNVNGIKSGDASNDAFATESGDKTVLYVNQKEHEEVKPKLWKRFLKCFCAITNGKKILDTSNKGDLRCVHGVRFLSMSWVILGHTYAFLSTVALVVGGKEALARMNTLPFQGISHGVLAVDSFFLLSGFLLTYLFLKEADRRDGKINWGLYYFHRYWRLTPVYAILLGFDYALTRYITNGPLWPEAGNEAVCKDTWWWNLLYINNLQNDKFCFGWSWFLANDMQFYVISPIFLYCLWRWPKIGLSLVSSVLMASWICSACISWHYDFLPGLGWMIADVKGATSSMQNYFQKFYIRPYTRIGPYMVGMILGYLLYKDNERKFVLKKSIQIVGWTTATVLSLAVIYCFYDGIWPSGPGRAVSAIYNALSASIFTMALGWVIFMCLTGRAGFVNTILSYELFVPLSRLTYCAYLVHPIIIMGYYQSLESSIQFTSMMATTLFLGFLVLSYMAAFVISLLLEAPFMAVEKLFIKRT